jgi:hypothetical protein
MGRIASLISGAFIEPSLRDFSSNRGTKFCNAMMPMLEATASAAMQSRTNGAVFVVLTPP